MALSSIDLVGVHAVAGPLDEILERRRATYDAAVELASGDARAANLDRAVVDHPVVRAHLGEVLAGVADLDMGALTSVDLLVTAAGQWVARDLEIRVASAASAPRELSGAVRRISEQLDRNGAQQLGDLVLHDGSPAFRDAVGVLRRGIDMALAAAPDLMLDLLPHVALIALLDPGRAGRLGSASVREYPGLVVLPALRTPLEAAEALVHEGAHQKLFDLAIVGSVFADGYHAAPLFTPPWGDPGAVPWPLEQAVAAHHAYCCLAAFYVALDRPAVHAHSLLPRAGERATIIGEWLVEEQVRFLGRNGREFVRRLHGNEIPQAVGKVARAGETRAESIGAARTAVRHCGAWDLTMRWSRPVEILWNRSH